jgi:hypothetical protein
MPKLLFMIVPICRGRPARRKCCKIRDEVQIVPRSGLMLVSMPSPQPSPRGRGTEGEGICATMLVVPRILQQFPEAGRYQPDGRARRPCRANEYSESLSFRAKRSNLPGLKLEDCFVVSLLAMTLKNCLLPTVNWAFFFSHNSLSGILLCSEARVLPLSNPKPVWGGASPPA